MISSLQIYSFRPPTTANAYSVQLQTKYDALMIGIAVSLSGSSLDYTAMSSRNAAFQVMSLNPINSFDSIINPILGLLCQGMS